MFSKLKYLFLLLCYNCFGQGNNFPSGAAGYAVGESNVTMNDVYSVANNIAGIATSKAILAGAAFQNRYNLSALNSSAAILSIPVKSINIGFQISQYGDRYFNESAVGIGIAHGIGIIQLGAKVNVIQVKSYEAHTRIAVTGELGGIINLSKQLTFGAHIYNFNQASIHTNGKKIGLPVILKSGIKYTPYRNIHIYFEILKDIVFQPAIKAGVEYLLVNRIFIRSGISSNNRTITAGTGIILKKINIGYAISNHPSLGFIQQLGLIYTIKSLDEGL